MIRELLHGVKYILGNGIAGPNLTVFPDDIFIVSYPKSGNTWTRFLIANLLHPRERVTFANIEQVIPHIEGQSISFFKKMPRPRIIKCHECFDPRYRTVVYVVRDPRDVIVSQFHFQRKNKVINDTYPVDRFVTHFLAGETSIEPRYGSWADNVVSWLALRENSPRFLLLRYEDMLADPVRELGRVAEFLAIQADSDRLARAVELSSADRMRKLEEVQAGTWRQTKHSRKDIPFVRSAASGGWKSILPESSITKVESAWGPWMGSLGYELSVR